MHRKRLIAVGLAAVILAGAAVTVRDVQSRLGPARFLGWKRSAAEALAERPSAASPLSALDPLLGFSRYLPEEIAHYGSVLQAGRVWKEFAGSSAVRRLAETPALKTFLAEAGKEFDPGKLPAEGRKAIDLLKAAFDSEIAVALPEESPSRALNILKAIVLSAAVLTPSPHPPRSDPDQTLAEKRKPLRTAWESSIRALEIPSLVLAARVKDEKRFDEFIKAMLDHGWLGFSAALGEGASEGLRKALENGYRPVTIGGVTLGRIQLSLKDLLPATPDELPDGLPMGKAEAALVLESLRRISIEVDLGFLGEYFTVVISSDDKLIRQIVERFEGKSKATLAASKAFERMRGLLSADSIGVTYADGRRLEKELREGVLPLIPQILDPQLLSLLGIPAEVVSLAPFIRQDLEDGFREGSLLDEKVITLDRGIRRTSRSETKAPAPVAAAARLATPDMAPDSCIGYFAVGSYSLDSLWARVRTLAELQKAEFAPMKAQAADNPQLAAMLRRQEELIQRIIDPIEKKIAPALRGEMGVILGAPVRLSIQSLPEVQGISIPTMGLVVHSDKPEMAVEGIQELFQGLVEAASGLGGPGPPPVALVKRDLNRIEALGIEYRGEKIQGFEPHLARMGKALIFSSSNDLTRSLVEAAAGKTPRLSATENHRSMAGFIDPGGFEASYIDGRRLVSAFRTIADGVFGALERESGKGGNADAPEKRQQLDQVKSFVGELIVVLGCFRGQASSTTRDGAALVGKEWIHITDLEAK